MFNIIGQIAVDLLKSNTRGRRPAWAWLNRYLGYTTGTSKCES
jgi:hypothetical protein